MSLNGAAALRVGGEFAIKRLLGSETGRDSTAAKRIDQTRQEEVMLLRYVTLEWCRQALALTGWCDED